MADYVSKHTGAEIDEAVDNALGVTPVTRGGTGAADATKALENLGAASAASVIAAQAAASNAQAAAGNAQAAANNAQTIANSKAPMYTYGTDDLEAGVTALESGKLHFVYE